MGDPAWGPGMNQRRWGVLTRPFHSLTVPGGSAPPLPPQHSEGLLELPVLSPPCGHHTSTPTGSSSSSGSENVERRDMLDSECRERTEMAESERRGVLMGGCSVETGAHQWGGGRGQAPVHTEGSGPPGPPHPRGCSLRLQGPWCVYEERVQCPGPLPSRDPGSIGPPTHACQLSLCKWRDFLLFNSVRTR